MQGVMHWEVLPEIALIKLSRLRDYRLTLPSGLFRCLIVLLSPRMTLLKPDLVCLNCGLIHPAFYGPLHALMHY